jgi:SAM-dependent methyltransferase
VPDDQAHDESVRLFYDLTAEETAERWYGNEILLPTLRDFLSLLPPSPRILDLGCGPGHESMRLTREGAHVVGLDFSAECLRIARERNPGLRFEELDFLELDERFGVFDGILAAASLIHVAPHRLPSLLKRIASVLTPGGTLAVIYQIGMGFRDSRPEVDGRRLDRRIYLYEPDNLKEAGAAEGLRYVRDGYLEREVQDSGWSCLYLQRIER